MDSSGGEFFLTQEQREDICVLLLFNEDQCLVFSFDLHLLLEHLHQLLVPLHSVHLRDIVEGLSHILAGST